MRVMLQPISVIDFSLNVIPFPIRSVGTGYVTAVMFKIQMSHGHAEITLTVTEKHAIPILKRSIHQH